MKRLLVFLCLFTSFSWTTIAKQVEENTARTVAGNFFASRIGKNQLTTLPTPVLVCTSNDLTTGQDADSKAAPAFYVYNFTGARGFVIIAGDDIVTPILGYSTEGYFSTGNIAPAAASFLWSYDNQIKSSVAQKLPATPEIELAWNEYLAPTGGSNNAGKASKTEFFLVKLYWDQSPYYNSKCPKDKTFGGQTLTGCVATAMAMVMKYHNYPKVGTGSYKYKPKNYDMQEANFGTTRYNWSIMPDSLRKDTDSIVDDAVATLMYHCGVAVQMNYGLKFSGAWMIEGGMNRQCTEKALKTYFDYDPAMRGLSHKNYNDNEWADLLKEDLDAGLPVLYVAYDPRPAPVGGGHAFICDGYNDNGMFHFNWGWGGWFDGYFQLNNLNPGDSGKKSDYSCGHEMIKGVRPMPGQGKYFNLNLDTPVTLLSDVIQYEDSISLTSRIRNNGTTPFNGSLGAAIFDTNQILIGFVELDDPATIQPGERYGVRFQNSGLPAMLPGKYLIGIMYKTMGDDWKEVNDTLTYVNFPLLEVINPDVIEMASTMTVLPAVPLIEYKAASVKLEIRNTGSQDFSGTLNLAIHDIDGNYLYPIELKSNFTLPAGTSSGQLTFSTNSLPVYAGSYLLALWYKPLAKAEYELIGSSNFGNPVRVQVDASPLVKDSYEPNDSLPIATVLPLSFSGNKAIVKTVNANCHVGTDVDMYKIQLPMGNSYTIDAKIRNSDYDTTLTRPLNGFLSYWGPQDTAWYYTCNNLNPPQFVTKDGGDLLFFVETNFIKQTGMYQMEIEISKNPLGIEESDLSSNLVAYPNPSTGIVYLANRSDKATIADITVRNMLGRAVYRQQAASVGTDPYPIDLSGLAPGIYIVTLRDSKNQQSNIKLSIAR